MASLIQNAIMEIKRYITQHQRRRIINRLLKERGDSWIRSKPKMGISSCLIGEPVRFDGGHKRNRFITDTLGRFFEWLPVCPEVECGLSTPRESMHLEGNPKSPRLVTSRSHLDHTERMMSWAKKRVQELENEDLCAFIFKSNSPSSGIEKVRIYHKNGSPQKIGIGVFARAFMEHFPLLPVEDDEHLNDPHLRENFIERIFCLKRHRELLKSDGSVGDLVSFHTEHKMLLMAHSPQLNQKLGRLVAQANRQNHKELFKQYRELMLKVLKGKATIKKNSNVLLHMMGFLKKQLTADDLKIAIIRHQEIEKSSWDKAFDKV
jgi:uncharacterized protein YbbK (DUF523 family)